MNEPCLGDHENCRCAGCRYRDFEAARLGCDCGPCSRGEWVATDEWSTLYQCQRHIAVPNLERLGSPTAAGEPTVVS